MINDMLVGINLSTVATSVLTASLVERFFGAWAMTVAAAILVLCILIFAEIVPKAVAYTDPTATALLLTPVAAVASRLFRPLAWTLGIIPSWLARRIPERQHDLNVTEESLTEMVRLGVEQGQLSPEATDVVSSILASGDLPVDSLMVHLPSVVGVPVTASIAEMADAMSGSGYSRLPVYREHSEQVVGVVHVKDVFARLYQGRRGTAAEIMRPIMRIRRDRMAADVLADMRTRRQHIGLVVDPAQTGRAVGLITIQDLLEEIVGEVLDAPAVGIGFDES